MKPGKPARRRPTAFQRARAREAEERREQEEHFASAFRFLTDLGYTGIGRIPVTLAEVDVRGFVNARAGRQLELSGHPFGVTFHGVLRRFVGSAPAPYEDLENTLEVYEIARALWPGEWKSFSHNFVGWGGVVDATAALFRENVDLLTGTSWIPRVNVIAVAEVAVNLDDMDGRQLGASFYTYPPEIASGVAQVQAIIRT